MKLKNRWGLTLSLVMFVFAIMMVATLLTALLVLILHLTDILPFLSDGRAGQSEGFGGTRIIVLMMVSSTLIGTAIAAFFSKKALEPIRKVIDATHKIADGDFNTRIELKGIQELEELSLSFNKMTDELSAIETLRRDFINNFSHEFKTPIVSVRGFAKLLKNENLGEGEKQEYLDIIISEAERLAALSTNILNLAKYENIGIITDKSVFRLDEQIRKVIALTEPAWSAKDIELNVDMEEISFDGNEDLTQQVWLNLIDNAIKFSNQNGTISIRLAKWNGGIRFIIKDNGIGMDEKTKSLIFDKFFQEDSSRTKAGNGLGLTIVKRIIELHGGQVEVQGELGMGSEFIVWLQIVK